MKTLVLMRHAKTEGSNPHGDKARELLPEGLEDARRAGETLATLGLEQALVSPSQRTRQTFGATGVDIPVEFRDEIYEDSTVTLLNQISAVDESVTSVIMVGHAPTIPMLASHLFYAHDPREADQLQSWFPAGTFVVLDVDCPWAQLDFHAANPVKLRSIHRP